MTLVSGDTLTDLAIRTFQDLVLHWSSATLQVLPSEGIGHLPNLRLNIPLFFSELSDAKIDCLLWVNNQSPPASFVESADGDAFECKITRGEFKTLREKLEQGCQLYLLLAAPQQQIAAEELSALLPKDRFNWWMVDLRQIVDKCNSTVESAKLFIPVQNELDLSTFSVFWAALWVKFFFEPLRNPRLRRIASYSLRPAEAHVQVANWSLFDLAFPEKNHAHADWRKSFDDAFKVALPNLRAFEHRTIELLEMGYRLQDIVYRLSTATSVDKIQVYCPEALQGTVSLWMFSRFYQQFMIESANVRGWGLNQRFLPYDVHHSPVRVLRRCLLMVRQIYQRLSVRVDIVNVPSEHPGRDYSVYGGNIGHFPWYKFPIDKGIERHESKRYDIEESLDVFDRLERKDIILADNYYNGIGQVISLDYAEKFRRKPLYLLPPEDRFIKHPNSLWDRFF